jgi:hypothetical protein
MISNFHLGTAKLMPHLDALPDDQSGLSRFVSSSAARQLL